MSYGAYRLEEIASSVFTALLQKHVKKYQEHYHIVVVGSKNWKGTRSVVFDWLDVLRRKCPGTIDIISNLRNEVEQWAKQYAEQNKLDFHCFENDLMTFMPEPEDEMHIADFKLIEKGRVYLIFFDNEDKRTFQFLDCLKNEKPEPPYILNESFPKSFFNDSDDHDSDEIAKKDEKQVELVSEIDYNTEEWLEFFDSIVTKEAFMRLRAIPGVPKVVHCKHTSYDVYIGRPSKWGNPFRIDKSVPKSHGFGSRLWSIMQYRDWIIKQEDLMNDLPSLTGKTLGCWCSPHPCHGDILALFLAKRLEKSN